MTYSHCMSHVRRVCFLLLAIVALGCSRARGEPRPAATAESHDSATSLDVLKRALASKDYATRLITVQAIGDVRAYDLVAWLEPVLGDPEHDVRVAAIEALRRMGSPRARHLLRSVRDDKTEVL